jgi:hypothetical protein
MSPHPHPLAPSSSDAVHFAQEPVRKNNESAAIHRAYLRRRSRRKSALKLPKPAKLPRKILDALDWMKAQREARPIRAVGFFLPCRTASPSRP